MQKKIKISKEEYEKYKAFRRNNWIGEERVMHLIAEDTELYQDDSDIADRREKISVPVRCERADYIRLKNIYGSLTDDMIPRLISRFLEVHRGDNYKATGKSVSVYFSGKEMKKIEALADGKIAEYIKKRALEPVREEYDKNIVKEIDNILTELDHIVTLESFNLAVSSFGTLLVDIKERINNADKN